MTVSEFIKTRLTEMKLSQAWLAEKLGITRQNLNNKLSRDNFSSQEMCRIAELLGTDFVFKNDKQEFLINYNNISGD